MDDKQPSAQSVTTEVMLNPAIQALMSDGVNVGKRTDGLYLLRFIVGLPEGRIEQAKIMMMEANIIAMVGELCKLTNHYPVKPKSPGKKTSPKK